MNQTKNQTAFSVKGILLTVTILLAVFLLLCLITSLLLIRVPHFETYYTAASFVILALLAVLTAILSRSRGSAALPYAALTSGAFSVVTSIAGAVVAKGEFDLISVLIRFTGLVALSVLMTFLLSLRAAKKKRGAGKFRFAK